MVENRDQEPEYRPLTTYARLRSQGHSLFSPNAIVRARTFEHRQVYRFEVHEAKLKLLLTLPAHQHLAPLASYLHQVDTAFLHHLFQTAEHRSSKFPATVSLPTTRKENHATRLAVVVLPTSPSNKSDRGRDPLYLFLERTRKTERSIDYRANGSIPNSSITSDTIYYIWRQIITAWANGIFPKQLCWCVPATKGTAPWRV